MKRCLGSVVIALVGLHGCHRGGEGAVSPAAAPAEVEPAPDLTLPVVAIEVDGLDADRTAAARKLVGTKIGQPLDKVQVRRDLRALWSLGGIGDVEVRARAAAGGVALRYALTGRPSLGAVELGGAVLGPRLFDPRALVGAERGQVFDPVALERGRGALLDAYREQGFARVEVTYATRAARTGVVDLTIAVTEGKAYTIASLGFPGSARFKAGELAAVIEKGVGSAVGTPYVRERIEAGLLHLNAAYFDRGHVNVRVGPVAEQYDEVHDTVALVIPVVEGDQFRLGKVEFKGALAASAKEYRARIRLKTGEVFNRSRIAEGMARVGELHKAKGQPEPRIEPETHVDPAKKRIDVTFVVAPP